MGNEIDIFNLDSVQLETLLSEGKVTAFDIAARYLRETAGSDLRAYDGPKFGTLAAVAEPIGIEEGSTLDAVLSDLNIRSKSYDIVTHPRDTVTVEEKHELFEQHPQIYQHYGDIVVVQGSVLSYKDRNGKECMVLYFNNGEERINFRELKRKLGIPKKKDLRFLKGDLKSLVGLASGEVSPLIPITQRIKGLYFDAVMMMEARNDPTQYYDLALSKRQSLFVNVADMYNSLIRTRGRYLRILSI